MTTWQSALLDAREALTAAREHAPSPVERAGLERAITQIDRLLLVSTAYSPSPTYYLQDRHEHC